MYNDQDRHQTEPDPATDQQKTMNRFGHTRSARLEVHRGHAAERGRKGDGRYPNAKAPIIHTLPFQLALDLTFLRRMNPR
jgi:hypothetical protein